MKETFDKKNFNLDDYRFGDQEEVNCDPALQDYLKLMYEQIKYENKLVGEFSVNGTYSISEPRMIDFLIKEVKFFQERNGDEVIATRVLEDVILKFRIVFNMIGGLQQAFLFLEERERRIDEDDIIHKTRLAEIVKVNHSDFVNYVYKEWNVWLSPQDFALEDDYILKYLREQAFRFNSIRELLSISSQIYVLSMVPILKNLGPKGLLISNEYNNLFGKIIGKNPNFANNWLGKKNLLDQIMKKHNFFPQLGMFNEAVSIFKDFTTPFKSMDMFKAKGGLEMKPPILENKSLPKPDFSMDMGKGKHL